jgi:hypothetical protein
MCRTDVVLQTRTVYVLPTNPVITLDHRKTKPYTALRFAEVVELVDTSVSKTDGLCSCRFDSGLRYQREETAPDSSGAFSLSSVVREGQIKSTISPTTRHLHYFHFLTKSFDTFKLCSSYHYVVR